MTRVSNARAPKTLLNLGLLTDITITLVVRYCSVLSKWEFFIKMRAALLAPILPRVMEEGESKKAALILMKNSHFDRTLWYTFIDLLSFHIKLSTTKWIIRGQKSQVFCPSCMIPIPTQKEQAWKRLKNEIKILTGGQRPTQYVLNKRWCPIGDMSIEHSTMLTKCEIFTSLRDLVFLLLDHSKSSGFFSENGPIC